MTAGCMRRLLFFIALFLLLAFSAGAGVFDDFSFAIFDKAGFATRVDGQKIEGSLSDNFSNSAGFSLFMDEGFDGDDLRGTTLFSLFCMHDFARYGGVPHNSIRYGMETSLFFLNTGISQCYDFNNNEIDCIFNFGFKIGAWVSSHVGFEVNAGIEHGFISHDNFVRMNAGILIAPFSEKKSRSPKTEQSASKNEDQSIDEAFQSEGTEKIERLCRRYSEYPSRDNARLRLVATEFAVRKFGVGKDDVVSALFAEDLENPYLIPEESIVFVDSFVPVAFTEDGVVFAKDDGERSSDDFSFRAYFFVKRSPETMEGKKLRRGFFRARGVQKRFVGGIERIIPVFEYGYCF